MASVSSSLPTSESSRTSPTAGRRSDSAPAPLTSVAPGLRAALNEQLAELGLVAMGVTRWAFTEGDDSAPSEDVQAFTITEIEASGPPPSAGPVIDRSVLTGSIGGCARSRGQPVPQRLPVSCRMAWGVWMNGYGRRCWPG